MCKMKVVKIPFFKEVTLMAVACDECGYRSNEIKAGGGIETPKPQNPEDMKNDGIIIFHMKLWA